MKRSALPLVRGQVGLGEQVPEAELAAGASVHGRAITGTVVTHHPLDGDAHRFEPGDGALQEASRGFARLVGEHLDVGEAGGFDADVAELPTSLAEAPVAGSARPNAAVAGDAMARDDDPPELLHVDVDELAGRFRS